MNGMISAFLPLAFSATGIALILSLPREYTWVVGIAGFVAVGVTALPKLLKRLSDSFPGLSEVVTPPNSLGPVEVTCMYYEFSDTPCVVLTVSPYQPLVPASGIGDYGLTAALTTMENPAPRKTLYYKRIEAQPRMSSQQVRTKYLEPFLTQLLSGNVTFNPIS